MRDAKDPQTLGDAILQFKQLHGCSILVAADRTLEWGREHGVSWAAPEPKPIVDPSGNGRP